MIQKHQLIRMRIQVYLIREVRDFILPDIVMQKSYGKDQGHQPVSIHQFCQLRTVGWIEVLTDIPCHVLLNIRFFLQICMSAFLLKSSVCPSEFPNESHPA